jgi:hypothetical protein
MLCEGDGGGEKEMGARYWRESGLASSEGGKLKFCMDSGVVAYVDLP